jgi:hypothetical protein
MSRLLACVGIVLLALCAVAAVRRQDVLASSLAVLGLGAIVLAVLAPRLTGPVELGPSGFKLQLVEQLSLGQSVGYSEAEILDAIKHALAEEESRTAPSDVSSSSGRPESAPPDRDAASESLLPAAVGARPRDAATDAAALAEALFERWERTNSPNDLDEAIARVHMALAQTPPESPLRAPLLILLTKTQLALYQTSGDQSALAKGIEDAHETLATSPPDSPTHRAALQLLATALMNRYASTGEIGDQDQAIELLSRLDEARQRQAEGD